MRLCLFLCYLALLQSSGKKPATMTGWGYCVGVRLTEAVGKMPTARFIRSQKLSAGCQQHGLKPVGNKFVA